jgi:hypothetical protein
VLTQIEGENMSNIHLGHGSLQINLGLNSGMAAGADKAGRESPAMQAAGAIAGFMHQNGLDTMDANKLFAMARNDKGEVSKAVQKAASMLLAAPKLFQAIDSHGRPGADGKAPLHNFDQSAQGRVPDIEINIGAGGSAGDGVQGDAGSATDMQSAAGTLGAHMRQAGIEVMDPNKLYELATDKDGNVPEDVQQAAKFMLSHPEAYKQIETRDVAGADGKSGAWNFDDAAKGLVPGAGSPSKAASAQQAGVTLNINTTPAQEGIGQLALLLKSLTQLLQKLNAQEKQCGPNDADNPAAGAGDTLTVNIGAKPAHAQPSKLEQLLAMLEQLLHMMEGRNVANQAGGPAGDITLNIGQGAGGAAGSGNDITLNIGTAPPASPSSRLEQLLELLKILLQKLEGQYSPEGSNGATNGADGSQGDVTVNIGNAAESPAGADNDITINIEAAPQHNARSQFSHLLTLLEQLLQVLESQLQEPAPGNTGDSANAAQPHITVNVGTPA